MKLLPALALLVACGSSDEPAANPPHLWIALKGAEVNGQIQLVPIEPAPF